MRALDLKGKKIAIFGCGDETMSDTFCNAVGILYDRLRDTGATFIGSFPAGEYHYNHSAAIVPIVYSPQHKARHERHGKHLPD